VASAFFITAALCGAGVPGWPASGAELLVFIATVKVFPIAGILAIAALVVGALFALRVVQNSFFNAPNPKFVHFEDVQPLPGYTPDDPHRHAALFSGFPTNYGQHD